MTVYGVINPPHAIAFRQHHCVVFDDGNGETRDSPVGQRQMHIVINLLRGALRGCVRMSHGPAIGARAWRRERRVGGAWCRALYRANLNRDRAVLPKIDSLSASLRHGICSIVHCSALR